MKFKLNERINTIRVMTQEYKEYAMQEVIEKVCEECDPSSPDALYWLQLEMESIFVREGGDEVVMKEGSNHPLLYHLLRFVSMEGNAMFESGIMLVENCLNCLQLAEENYRTVMVPETWEELGYLLYILDVELWLHLFNVIFSHSSCQKRERLKLNQS
jgi:hypothetical protein